jgi:hypothetical protein
LQKQFIFSLTVVLTLGYDVNPVTVAVGVPHCDIPPTVCFTPGLPSSDVTAHVPYPVWLLLKLDLVHA